MNTKVRLAARIETPDADALAKAGWDLEKTATPDPKDRSEKTLVEDGRKASDEPADVKVVADQREPVTSASKEADRTIRREEIVETDGPSAEKAESDAPESNSSETDTHNPFSSSAVLAAMKLAELEQELGLDASWGTPDKFARVAALEADSVETLNERINTLKQVREAGLEKPKQKVAKSLPRLAAVTSKVVEAQAEVNGSDVDAAIFR